MRGEHRLTLALAIGAAILLFTGLGTLDLWAPDEPRYAAIAEEVRSFRHGAAGLALLHLNGAAYTQKPPLYFWLAALAGAPGGAVTETAARLPSALCGFAVVLLVARFGARRFGTASGALAGAVLLTAFEFVHRARRAQLDILLTLLETAALFAFYRADRRGAPRVADIALLHGALGLAVLAKGPVGLIVPGLVIAASLAADRRASEISRWLPAWSLALSLGPGLLWLAAVLTLGPTGTFDGAVVENLFGRFFSGSSHARPATYYLVQFPLNFLPWTALWPLVAVVAVRRVFREGFDPERRRAWVFLLLWVAVSFAFFSLSDGKRGLYLLPAFPATALLCADAAVTAWGGGRALPRGVGRAAAVAATLAAGVAVAVSAGAVPDFATPWEFAAGLVATALAAAAAWRALASTTRPGLARLGVLAAALAACELCFFVFALPALDSEKSPRPVGELAAALVPEGASIGLAQKETLLGGLAYYSDRNITVLDGPSDVADFFRSGGGVVVAPERHLLAIARATPVAARARLRRGRRALLLITPADAPALR